MGRGEGTFSILYEFDVDLDQITKLTNLYRSKRNSRHVKLRSKVSPNSFALLCCYLSGENIEINESNAADLKLLGHEMKCPSLIKLVRDFETRSKQRDFSTFMDVIGSRLFMYKTGMSALQEKAVDLGSRCSQFWEYVSDIQVTSHEYKSAPLAVNDINLSGNITIDSMEILESALSRLRSLKSDVEVCQKKARSSLEFASSLKEDFLSSASTTCSDMNSFLEEKADFGDAWCQLRLGTDLCKRGSESGLLYLSMAQKEGSMVQAVDIARLLISDQEVRQKFDWALKFLEFPSDAEESRLRSELLEFCELLRQDKLTAIEKRCFSSMLDCLSVLVIPSHIESIADECFKECVNLREVQVEDGTSLFNCPCSWIRMSSIESIIIPDSVESLCDECFNCCSSLCHVVFRENSRLACVGERVFAFCDRLTDIEFPSSLLSLSSKWWKDSSISHIRFAALSGLSEIGESAFSGFVSLQEIEIPESVGVLGSHCFHNCSSLRSVKFVGDSCLKIMEDSIFSGCVRLRELVIPSRVEYLSSGWWNGCCLSRISFGSLSAFNCIYDDSFVGFTSLKELGIPADLEILSGIWWKGSSISRIRFGPGCILNRIEKGALSTLKSLESIEIPSSVDVLSNMWFSNSSISRVTFAPDSILKRIGSEAFSNYVNLRVIEIPGSVENIDDNCFCGLSSLFKVTFTSDSCLKRIGNGAFYGCSGLQELEIPVTIENIGEHAFTRCNLRRLSFSGNNELFSIMESFVVRNTDMCLICAFREHAEVKIPECIEIIGGGCFSGESISYVSFASECIVKKIERRAFCNCKNLVEIDIPACVEEIGDGCFSESSLSRIRFASGSVLNRIGNGAFLDCPDLHVIDIPESVREIGDDCFTGTSLSHINFSDSSRLERVGNGAFCGCHSLEEIDIPNSVQEIGDRCFGYMQCTDGSQNACYMLARVGFGSGLRRIGSEAFSNCQCLEEIDIPVGVVEIPDDCFSQTAISRVRFARNSRVARIGNGAFRGCMRLTEIEIPMRVEEIGPKAFMETGLSRITFVDRCHLNIIGECAFCSCKLDAIEIPSSVQEICDQCFSQTPLTSISFTNGSCLTRIGKEAFTWCMNLKEINIPISVREIGERCFKAMKDPYGNIMSSLSYVRFAKESTLEYVGTSALDGCVCLKGIFIPSSVKVIGDRCFCNCQSLERVVFGESSCLKSIGKQAFCGCKSLVEIEIPASVEEIEESCFSQWMDPDTGAWSSCSSLTHVTFEAGSVLKRIGSEAFLGCIKLKEIRIPDSVEEIGDYCFNAGKEANGNTSSLSHITFDSKSVLKHMGVGVFRGCDKLIEIAIPAHCETLEGYCFYGCSSLSHFAFLGCDSLKTIGREAFYVCSLNEITIPACVEEIGYRCFFQSSLSRISFMSGSVLKRIGNEAFAECRHLAEISIPECVEEIGEFCFNAMRDAQGNALSCLLKVKFGSGSVLRCLGRGTFKGCSYLERVDIPENLEEIGDYCFWDCRNLSRVVFGSRLKRIGKEAFCGCDKITQVSIPEGVETIGERCFGYWKSQDYVQSSCSSLSCVVFQWGIYLKCIESGVFGRCQSIKQIVIPATVEEIGDDSFSNCYGLSRVTFTSSCSLKRIGNRAFGGCRSLQKIEIPASVEEIGEKCFGVVPGSRPDRQRCCSSLSSVTFCTGSHLKRIGYEAFCGCGRLREIRIPPTVEEIGAHVFRDCNMKWVDLSGNYHPFYRVGNFIVQKDRMKLVCTISNAGIRSITIPLGIAKIGDECFSSLPVSFVTFTPGSNVKFIGKQTFSWCMNLRDIVIPVNVVEIDDECFSHSSLSHITFVVKCMLKRIGKEAFSECKNLTEIEIPMHVEEIGDGCFKFQNPSESSLARVKFTGNETLKRIGTDAFYGCGSLETIEIPRSVEELGDQCFRNCSSLSYVGFDEMCVLRRIGTYAFKECPEMKTMTIPPSVVEIGELR